jgi:glycosyltransferase involved in cell wall biosynthesis
MKELKVLHIITRLILGGAQENTLFTVEGLMNRGHRVTLATGPAVGPEGSLIERARKNGVDLIIIPALRREINPFRDTLAFFRLYRLIKKGGYDIVHTHSSKAGILGRIAARFAGCRVILHTIHGLPFHPYQNRLLNRIYLASEKMVEGFTARLIVVAEPLAQQAVKAGLAQPDKFVTIYSGIEMEKFTGSGEKGREIRSRFGIPEDAPVIGKVARLFHLKGHDYLLSAAPGIVRVFPEVRFLLVGDGILRKNLENKVKEMNLSKNFIFAGLVEPEKIPDFISTMDILVHLSLREGLARSIVQALASGKPVISFDIDGAREVVLDGFTGYLLKPGDIEGLSEKAVDLLQDRKTREKFGRQGQELVSKKWTVQAMVNDIEGLYKKLCGG